MYNKKAQYTSRTSCANVHEYTFGCDVKNTCHFLLYCPNSLTERISLLSKVTNIDSNILNQAYATITKALLLFGNSK